MNEKNFEIILMVKKEYLSQYFWYLIPNVGDMLSLSENKIFLVKDRLLPTSNSTKVVLFGDIV